MLGKGLFIAGTDTGVGKTFVTAGINYILRKNKYSSISFKPVQSGGVSIDKKLVAPDVEFIKDVAGIDENIKMNSYCFSEPVSPHLAAEIENETIKREKIIKDYQLLKSKYDYLTVEGVGGVAVPLVRNEYYTYDLIRDLDLPVLIVARAGVGTINHTLLTASFLKNLKLKVKGILVNEYTGSYYEKDNIKVIKEYTGLKIIGTIDKVDFNKEEHSLSCIRNAFEKNLALKEILELYR